MFICMNAVLVIAFFFFLMKFYLYYSDMEDIELPPSAESEIVCYEEMPTDIPTADEGFVADKFLISTIYTAPSDGVIDEGELQVANPHDIEYERVILEESATDDYYFSEDGDQEEEAEQLESEVPPLPPGCLPEDMPPPLPEAPLHIKKISPKTTPVKIHDNPVNDLQDVPFPVPPNEDSNIQGVKMGSSLRDNSQDVSKNSIPPLPPEPKFPAQVQFPMYDVGSIPPPPNNFSADNNPSIPPSIEKEKVSSQVKQKIRSTKFSSPLRTNQPPFAIDPQFIALPPEPEEPSEDKPPDDLLKYENVFIACFYCLTIPN